MLSLIHRAFKNGVINHFLLLINIFENLKQIVDYLYRDMLIFLVRMNELGQEFYQGNIMGLRDQIEIVVDENML